MNRAHKIISWLGDDGKAIMPIDAREEQYLLLRSTKSDSLLMRVPFVEMPHRNNTSPACGEFLVKRLGAALMISPPLRGSPQVMRTASLSPISMGAGFPGRTSPATNLSA